MRVSQQALDAYRDAVGQQAELARAYVERSLDAYFAANPGYSTEDGRRFAIELLKASMPNFCDAAGTLAADFFDEIAEETGETVDSRLYDMTDYSIVEDKVRYFAGVLNGGDVAAFVSQVVDATGYFVRRSAFDNMVENCRANDVRFARVPTGFETCAFCFMLASRGFVYASEESAGKGHPYHENCDCIPVPGFQDASGNPRVEIDGYDPQAMHENWLSCERTVGGLEQARAEWLALPDDVREAYIDRHGAADRAFARFRQNRILREVETRDWHWLYTGDEPKLTYANDELRERKLSRFPHEVETVMYLRRFGVRTDFVEDEVPQVDGNGVKTGRVVSYADLGSGFEIKTTRTASTYNTVNGYLKNTGKKRNARYVVFDNRGNENMGDDELIGHINRSRTFLRGRVYIVDHSGEYRFIR